MKKNTYTKLVSILIGIAGLVAVYFLGSFLSSAVYFSPAEAEDTVVSSISGQTEGQAPKEVLTEEQIAELLAGMKKGYEEALVSRDDIIDFEALWKVNPDVYAWITVPGTVIDYPILQHDRDNSFYLLHNIDGSYGYPGCIYTENLNTTDFTDANTVIYGHNMKNGTMFAGLHDFKSKDFFDTYSEVIIYMPECTLRYEIFAAYVYDDRHLLLSFDCSDTAVFQSYLSAIYDIRDMTANIRRDFTVTQEDKIITLATCVSNQDDKRLLVQAVLRNE